jgi:hypothetical protein
LKNETMAAKNCWIEAPPSEESDVDAVAELLEASSPEELPEVVDVDLEEAVFMEKDVLVPNALSNEERSIVLVARVPAPEES